MEKLYAGIDIGGTKTTIGLFHRDLRPVQVVTIPTLPKGGCKELTDRIYAQYRRMLGQLGIKAEAVRTLGVASPGPLDLKTGRIIHIPTMGFRDEPLAELLTQRFGLPVSLENDTNAAVLAEATFGAGKGCDPVVYVTISTGVGAGLFVNGAVVDGHAFAGGELGHLVVDRHGRDCLCGSKGCLEMYASGTAIARIASERMGQSVTAKEAFALAEAGDPVACSVIVEAADYLGLALSAVYQILDPEVVILGGSVTKDYAFIKPFLHKALIHYLEPVNGRKPRVEMSSFDGLQVLLGAAYLGIQSCEEL